MPTLLETLQITMMSGQLRSAVEHSAHLLALEDGDPERAVKAGKDMIVDFVEAEYRAAATPEVQSQLAQQFETAATPKNHQAGGS